MRLRERLGQIAVFAAVLGLWEAAVRIFALPPQVLPRPAVVVSRLIELTANGVILSNLLVTAEEIAIGFTSGALLGLFAGYVLAKVPTLERILSPYILAMQTAPKISLAPLFVLWFGLGILSKVVLIALVTFFPVALNLMVGIRSVDRRYYQLLKILKASFRKRLFHVELMSTLPQLLTGLRIGMVLSVTAAVIGEMMGARAGLGFLLILGNEMYDIPLIISTILIIAVLSFGLDVGLRYGQRRLLHWHESEG